MHVLAVRDGTSSYPAYLTGGKGKGFAAWIGTVAPGYACVMTQQSALITPLLVDFRPLSFAAKFESAVALTMITPFAYFFGSTCSRGGGKS